LIQCTTFKYTVADSTVRLRFNDCSDSACVDALIESISHDTMMATNIFAALQDANNVRNVSKSSPTYLDKDRPSVSVVRL